MARYMFITQCVTDNGINGCRCVIDIDDRDRGCLPYDPQLRERRHPLKNVQLIDKKKRTNSSLASYQKAPPSTMTKTYIATLNEK
ncbi:hypothetical protein BLOT_008966 [Blomia tropicalis]|nr:hypothetical protein BLOT_008966 [Blomia tropicalis]